MLAKDSRILKENEFHPVQLRVFFVMITLYTFYFTCNNNLGVAADRIQQSFDLSNATFGILFIIFTLGFGLDSFSPATWATGTVRNCSCFLEPSARRQQYRLRPLLRNETVCYLLGDQCGVPVYGVVSGLQRALPLDPAETLGVVHGSV